MGFSLHIKCPNENKKWTFEKLENLNSNLNRNPRCQYHQAAYFGNLPYTAKYLYMYKEKIKFIRREISKFVW